MLVRPLAAVTLATCPRTVKEDTRSDAVFGDLETCGYLRAIKGLCLVWMRRFHTFRTLLNWKVKKRKTLNYRGHDESANSHILHSQVWRKTKMSHRWRWLEADKHLGGSGSSSRDLAVVSRMRTKDSNTIWLESWGERSICGSLLTQVRRGDSTGSQTHLYSKV